MKTSLQGWNGTWFYCENHEPSLPPFVGWLPEFQRTWSEEPTPLDLPHVAALTNKINLLKGRGLTGVCMATYWLACWVVPLKKHVHSGWEYSGLQDPSRETSENIPLELLVKLLNEMFQYTSNRPTDKQVRSYHIGVERDPVRCPCHYEYYCLLGISHLSCLNAGLGQLYFSHLRFWWWHPVLDRPSFGPATWRRVRRWPFR
jgi:hypothetical protein